MNSFITGVDKPNNGSEVFLFNFKTTTYVVFFKLAGNIFLEN